MLDGAMIAAGVPIPAFDISSRLLGADLKKLTHVIQAPLSFPKAISHAGSNDWKYSSG
jgi:hypothetical protein